GRDAGDAELVGEDSLGRDGLFRLPTPRVDRVGELLGHLQVERGRIVVFRPERGPTLVHCARSVCESLTTRPGSGSVCQFGSSTAYAHFVVRFVVRSTIGAAPSGAKIVGLAALYIASSKLGLLLATGGGGAV